MNDIFVGTRWATCNICGERYHVDPENGECKINGKYTRRCIAFHKESDSPSLQIENSVRFHEHREEAPAVRTDWY